MVHNTLHGVILLFKSMILQLSWQRWAMMQKSPWDPLILMTISLDGVRFGLLTQTTELWKLAKALLIKIIHRLWRQI